MSTQQRKFVRQVGWGEALYLEVALRSPGLRTVVEDAIIPAVGKNVGSRNTFAKLFDLDAAPSGTDGFRAWLLLTALGQDPAAWDIDDDIVPPAYEVSRLRGLVTVRSGWFSVTAA
jgi:hypothetical protein